MNPAIETHNLTKRYEDVTAVDALSLHVRQGEIYAFLGLNGAGKSTTIRMLLGMIKPSAGAVRVLGTPIRPGERQPWATEQGVTVFLSSHILGEVSLLADRIGIIHHGQLIQEMDAAKLEANRQQHLTLFPRPKRRMRGARPPWPGPAIAP